ncbi:hypothetical protein PDE_04264 [Penicillium oxalicum 114-2]|uniref:L-ornithine N(5)-oxygenase n=1 Tax=Penicillium oxalicum (strain 114-2 / CGMCC 5302) TaxID=933388 RepID=S7ZF82_PENO1|nr:hypothetical protein PDE_04264 [Penicillium oxalicum 114-2]
MDRVVIVGAGLYGLIAAKTYLQVSGAYDTPPNSDDSTDQFSDELPVSFTGTKHEIQQSSGLELLVLDSASDIGGTWAKERLYPNLFSQNSYGMYEFSDLPLSEVTPEDRDGVGRQFIAGWKINRYLRRWCEKWRLKKHIRLNWRVKHIRRLDSREWELNVVISTDSAEMRQVTVICDKLILATGLTSVPNLPKILSLIDPASKDRVLHAKDVGVWARNYLGYRPFPDEETAADHENANESKTLKHHQDEDIPLRSVVIYGGAKSAFDLVHFFATLHRKEPSLHLQGAPLNPVTVHWVIREDGIGPAWMTPPTSSSVDGKIIPSDQAASTRLLHYLDPSCDDQPTRLRVSRGSHGAVRKLSVEGSWLVRLLHGNSLGRWLTRRLWRSVDRHLEKFAQYDSDPKMQRLRPRNSVISCISPIGIANQSDLWDTIRSPHVKVYRASIEAVDAMPEGRGTKHETLQVFLNRNRRLNNIDLVVHATGYKPIVPIVFQPLSLRLDLGLSAFSKHREGLLEQDEDSHVEDDRETWVHGLKWLNIDGLTANVVRQRLSERGRRSTNRAWPISTAQPQLFSHRLFRRMISPQLVEEGDRSFAVMGVLYTSTIAVVAEVQALWVAAFLTGGFDRPSEGCKPSDDTGLRLNTLSRDRMDHIISEDVVLAKLTGNGLEVDAIHVSLDTMICSCETLD